MAVTPSAGARGTGWGYRGAARRARSLHPGGIGGPGVEALQRDVPKGVHALIAAKGAVPVGIEPDLEMQMGACALAGTAHRADALPVLHGVPTRMRMA